MKLLQFACLPLLLLILGQCSSAPESEWIPVTTAERSSLTAGMSVKQVWEKIGRPLEVEVIGPTGNHVVHTYPMIGEKYEAETEEYDFDEEDYVIVIVIREQPRVLKLHFVDGKLLDDLGK